MKAKLTTEMVEKTYWSCGIKNHYHKTEDVANRCITRHDQSDRIRMTQEREVEVRGMRDFAMINTWLCGSSMREMSRMYGVSATRVSQIIRWYCQIAQGDSGHFHKFAGKDGVLEFSKTSGKLRLWRSNLRAEILTKLGEENEPLVL